ncbi:threonine-phosphate decarboxylase CobD [Paenibacillus crassostreae]|uniref:threonine-phosphate decarboxylase n=1 Tax=Paenibacillus crassostreae TaxID=1763538 RepID=A0A167GIL5_9BACL|nr:threonine-phosphate decarboxylase CobD [Paenibacillus crassostreae]AOZ92146.1 threonine-phosphate decarboxylase [Paenibacillus crassostreae]OAB77607.1 threonine-phosphate decarboxylase [Paenibacillus crassostreae]
MLERYGHGGDLESATEAYGLKGDRFLDFSANINPLGPPQQVLQQLEDSLASIIRYPDPGHRKLKYRLGQKLSVNENNICIGNGAAECMALILLGLHPQKVGIIEPCFSEYRQLSEQFNAEVYSVLGRKDRDWKATIEDIEELMQQVDLLFIGQPNNPNGVQYTLEELRRLADTAEHQDTYLVVDEAFIDFIPPQQQATLLSELVNYPRTLLVRSMTKFYAIPGLRLGYTLAHPDVIRSMKSKQVTWSVNGLALLAGEAALESGEEFERSTLELICSERAALTHGLTELGCSVSPGEANFLLVRLPDPWIAIEMQRKLGMRGILIRSCAMYPGLEQGHIRVAVKATQDNRRLLQELRHVLEHEVQE